VEGKDGGAAAISPIAEEESSQKSRAHARAEAPRKSSERPEIRGRGSTNGALNAVTNSHKGIRRDTSAPERGAIGQRDLSAAARFI